MCEVHSLKQHYSNPSPLDSLSITATEERRSTVTARATGLSEHVILYAGNKRHHSVLNKFVCDGRTKAAYAR